MLGISLSVAPGANINASVPRVVFENGEFKAPFVFTRAQTAGTRATGLALINPLFVVEPGAVNPISTFSRAQTGNSRATAQGAV